MSVIRTHDVILYGGDENRKILLRPLLDEHLPYLYRWNADPEVLYWTEGDDVESYPPEVVREIYGGVSKNSHCFFVEVNGRAVGECWLQKMNLPQIIAMYGGDCDVRRIDMCIGEKEFWGKGIGTILVRMLVKFAFEKEGVDVLHCFCEDYNIRSRRVWEKNGFSLIMEEKIPQPSKGKLQYHWRLTREEYIRFTK